MRKSSTPTLNGRIRGYSIPNRPSAERVKSAAVDHRVRRNQPKPSGGESSIVVRLYQTLRKGK